MVRKSLGVARVRPSEQLTLLIESAHPFETDLIATVSGAKDLAKIVVIRAGVGTRQRPLFYQKESLRESIALLKRVQTRLAGVTLHILNLDVQYLIILFDISILNGVFHPLFFFHCVGSRVG